MLYPLDRDLSGGIRHLPFEQREPGLNYSVLVDSAIGFLNTYPQDSDFTDPGFEPTGAWGQGGIDD